MKIEPRMFTLPNGEVLTVRSLCAEDAEALNAFRNVIYSETYFMARYPEESDNARAIHLYEKVGFERYGIQPRAFKLKDGTYRDEIIMVKML